MKMLVFIFIGVASLMVFCTYGGYLIGIKSNRTGIKVEVSKASENDLAGIKHTIKSCFAGGKMSENILYDYFTLSGERISLSSLPPRQIIEYSSLMGQHYRQQLQLAENLALRLKLARDSKIRFSASLPPLEEFWEGKLASSEQELRDFYTMNRSSFPPEITFEDAKPSLQRFQSNKAIAQILRTEVNKLYSTQSMQLNVQFSCPPKLEIPELEYLPNFGLPDSKHELVFLGNPYCQKCRVLWPKFHRFVQKQAQNIRFRVALLATENDVTSEKLVRSTYCIMQELPEISFFQHAYISPLQGRTELEKVDAHILDYLAEKNIDSANFQQCLQSSDAAKFLAMSRTLAEKIGLNSEPIILINGKPAIGYIDEENLHSFLSSALIH